MLSWPPKDPDEYLDYGIDWSARVGSDQIVGSDWDIPDPLVGSVFEATNTFTSLWLAGGEVGKTYTITNHVTTAGGRLMDQSVKLKIQTK